MKQELEVPKIQKWQEQISQKSVPDAFRSQPWSLQGRITNKKIFLKIHIIVHLGKFCLF